MVTATVTTMTGGVTTSSPQPFRCRELISWKMIFSWTEVGVGLLGWFKSDRFIVHFISNEMLLLI